LAVWYSLRSFGIFFPFWYVWTKKNLATLRGHPDCHLGRKTRAPEVRQKVATPETSLKKCFGHDETSCKKRVSWNSSKVQKVQNNEKFSQKLMVSVTLTHESCSRLFVCLFVCSLAPLISIFRSRETAQLKEPK
jgi:hypothetical protein